MHNFDLTAFINKNPDDNKLVIQLTFIDSMAYSQFGQNGAYWGNNNQQAPAPQNSALNSNGLTWEEQNFMDEEQQKEASSAMKPDFSEYEWMMDLDEFDEQAMKRIEQNDDLDDMFYWDPSKGVTEGKSKVNKNQHQAQQQQVQPQESQRTSNRNHNEPSNHTHHTQNRYVNPFSSNFQNKPQGPPQKQAPTQSHSHSFNPLGQQQQNVMASGDGQNPSDDLSRAMGGVNLNKFHLNPDATTFVPSWLKK